MELLVVVAIISILAALLMPALKGVRESARSAVCVSNLKQIHTAVAVYANDWNDWLPPPGDFNATNSRWWRVLGGGSAATKRSYVGPPGPVFGPNKVLSWPWVAGYRRWPIFRCPGEKGVLVVPTGGDTDPAKWCTAYDLDLDNCSYDYNFATHNYTIFSTPNLNRRMTQPVDCPGGPGVVWLYLDCQAYTGVGWYYNYREGNIDNLSEPYLSAALYAFRHPGGRANAVFLDGHVGTLQHKSVTGQSLYITIWNDDPRESP